MIACKEGFWVKTLHSSSSRFLVNCKAYSGWHMHKKKSYCVDLVIPVFTICLVIPSLATSPTDSDYGAVMC